MIGWGVVWRSGRWHLRPGPAARAAAALALASAALAGAQASTALAAGTPAAGDSQPFSLQATALLGKNGVTDVSIEATSNGGAYQVPQSLDHVQLKSFDGSGELVYAKNLFEVAAPGGVAELRRDDLLRGQQLHVLVQVQTGETKNTIVLETTTTVRRRPDLAFASVQAPAEVTAGMPFTIAAQVDELNGEVGATGRLALLNGEEALDEVESISVPAGGSVGAMFALTLDQPGTYTLTAAISEVAPEEWDTSNDTTTFTVKVVEPYKTMSYRAEFWSSRISTNFDYLREGSPIESGQFEWAQQYLNSGYWTPDTIEPAGTLEWSIEADGAPAETVDFEGIKVGESCYFGHDATTDASLYICHISGGTGVYLWQIVGRYDYSVNYVGWFSERYEYNFGTFLPARQTLGVKLDMPDANGTHYGGSYTLGLSGLSRPWDESTEYAPGYTYHQWGEESSVSGSGAGQTSG